MKILVPDIGNFSDVEVIEVLVAEGESVEAEQGLITIETDKAAMDVPSTHAGKVTKLLVKAGDKVSQGSEIAELEASDGSRHEGAAPTGDLDAGAAPSRREEKPAPEKSEPIAAQSAAPTRKDTTLACDVLVLGAGPGGYTAAFRAADLGKKVILVERYPTLGGVCLNVGCIPSKALLHVARVMAEVETLGTHGVSFGEPKLDLEKLRGFKDGVVGQLTGGLKALAKKRKVSVVTGVGRFKDANHLAVEGDKNELIHFEHAIIAAGSSVVKLPGAPEDPRIIDSTGALALEDVPASLLVVGGGIIGLEMATVYAALGTKVSVVELSDGLMPGTDRDLVKVLQKRLESKCEAIWLSTKVAKLEAKKGGIAVSFDGKDAPESQTFDRVLVAIGRKPNGRGLGADAAGVTVDDRGFIPVDEQMRTNQPNIFAIGDVAGNPMLAHKATHEAKVAAEVTAGQKSAFDARVIPSVAYTDPEVAWCGMTETEAKQKGIKVGKGRFPWAASGRALALDAQDGFSKLLFDEKTGRVIGAGIVGPNAGDLISEAVLAIEMGADAHDIGLVIHPHPTLSETVAFSAEAFAGTLTDL
ncbi:MAG: dihydrolipoyl dehydrogenase [Gammaproteobacteria bacterium]